MSDTQTPFLGLTKPGVGASQDTWGDKLNVDNDKIDSWAKTSNDFADWLETRIAALEAKVGGGSEAIGTVKWWPAEDLPVGGWLLCNGAIYNISDYPTIGALLGNLWGGDGITTFAVPDLKGRITVGSDYGEGQLEGAYGSNVGSYGGWMGVILTPAQMPAHQHGGVTDGQGSHQHGANALQWTGSGAWVSGGSAQQVNTLPVNMDPAGFHS